MKSYLSLFRIRMIKGLQYRTVALGSILMRFCWGLMEILAFSSIHKTGGSFSMTFSQTASYIWVQQAFLLMYNVIDGGQEIEASIHDGSIAYELAHPMNLYGSWYTQCLANRLSPTAINCLPVLVFALFVPLPYRLILPDLVSAILFLISTLLALGVVGATAVLMHITMFYTTSQRGVKIIGRAVTSFFAGGLIPLPYFPETFQEIVKLLSFASTQSTPLLIYSGSLTGAQAVSAMGLQVFWFLVLSALGYHAMRSTLNRVVIQGG